MSYRYSSNGVYYARIKIDGKEIKRSLGSTDPALARRKLSALKDELRQIDRSQGRVTLGELCDRYLKTVQHQKPKTVDWRTFIVSRIGCAQSSRAIIYTLPPGARHRGAIALTSKVTLLAARGLEQGGPGPPPYWSTGAGVSSLLLFITAWG